MFKGPWAKLVTAQQLLEITNDTCASGTKVFTNGCFELLHRGHVDYLLRCKELGDLLIVGLNTDESVRRLKGENRPVTREQDRAFILAALECVDFVVFFSEDDPLQLIQVIQPEVLVKGGDWPEERIVGREVVHHRGGWVYSLPLLEGYSTTGLMHRISASAARQDPHNSLNNADML
ncbi:MAG: D-glycero-beta-D-manno-heptose 1-phosphate adenylyltransferase [Desulfohalobiaceae bacterium]|nr:D-glycero-beta-D-manno-heptose 1-phosphate adenylyltransferase [Desulfohalobiaceae bacterium]